MTWSAPTRAADRLMRARRRGGWPCWLLPDEVQAVADAADLWRRRGLPPAVLDYLADRAGEGVDACIAPDDVAALTPCERCGGDGEWSPPPHDTYPQMCPDCGATGWTEEAGQ